MRYCTVSALQPENSSHTSSGEDFSQHAWINRLKISIGCHLDCSAYIYPSVPSTYEAKNLLSFVCTICLVVADFKCVGMCLQAQLQSINFMVRYLSPFPISVSKEISRSYGSISTDLYNNVQVDGGDIFFTNSTGTKLDHEIEKIDWHYSSTQVHLVAWVRIPFLSNDTDTDISMYYGNPTSPNQDNPAGVWKDDYLMVQHFDEVSGNVEDSTNNNYDGTAQNGVELGATGKIGWGASFDGIDDVIVGTSTHSYSYDNFTLSAIYQSAETFLVDDQYIFSHQPGYMEEGIVLAVSDDTVDRAPMRISIYTDTDTGEMYSGEVNITTKTWHYLVGVRDDDTINLYVDGVLDRSRSSTYGGVTINVTDGTLLIGDMPSDSEQVNGLLDEVRVSTSVRSAGWVLTNYRNIFSPGSFYSVSMKETSPVITNWAQPSFRYRKNISFFDQRHGPIPIIVIPEILKDNFNKLVELSDRSFSGTGFADDFTSEITSSYDFVIAHGLRTSVMSFGYALERPQARGGKENITLNILIHKDVFNLINQFLDEIQVKVHQTHLLMDKSPSEKKQIEAAVSGIRTFVSRIILSYQNIYGTTELVEEE